jgi:putative lipoprotein
MIALKLPDGKVSWMNGRPSFGRLKGPPMMNTIRLMIIACLILPIAACDEDGEYTRVNDSGANFEYATPEPAEPVMAAVTGTVWYRQRIALPENAIINVQLQDVSLQDVAATVLAEQIIEAAGRQAPFAFELEYDASTIDERSTYAISARITVDGDLWFINTTHHPVLTHGHPSHIDVMVDMVRSE